jgi:hypothetical protein
MTHGNVSWVWLQWLAALGGVTGAAGCSAILGIEDLKLGADAAAGDFGVQGTAAGLLGPVELELRAGDVSEKRVVEQDGAFAFEARLSPGTGYAVSVVQPGMPCTVANESGTIAGADAVIELACEGPALAEVSLAGGTTAIELVPGQTEYTVDLPLWQHETRIRAMVTRPGDVLAIGGVAVDSGEDSEPMALRLGGNEVDIVVENAVGWKRTYRLALRRAREILYAKASHTAEGNQLGYSVAVSGDLLAVGAPYEDSAARGINGDPGTGAPDSGAVYVFRREGTTWVQEAYIKASNTGFQDWFGWSVSLSDDVLAVGALGDDSAATGVDGNQDDNSATSSGAVFVFRRSSGAWQQEAYIKASNTEYADYFGQSVSVSGDALAVGAYSEDSAGTGVNSSTQADNTAQGSGAVYVFRRGGRGWAQEAYIKASNPAENDQFGWSVSLSGDLLAVGAHVEDSNARGINGDQTNNSANGSGAVYIFRRSGSWAQEAYVKASNTRGGDRFGESVSIAGDTMTVGAPDEDNTTMGVGGGEGDYGAANSGAVYVFRRTNNIWAQEAYIKASDTAAGDQFGYSVSIKGDVLAVGALNEGSAATGIDGDQASEDAARSGAVYVFRRSGSTWAQDAYLKAPDTRAEDGFGSSVAVADGVLAVGAPGEDSAGVGPGADPDDSSAASSGAFYILH